MTPKPNPWIWKFFEFLFTHDGQLGNTTTLGENFQWFQGHPQPKGALKAPNVLRSFNSPSTVRNQPDPERKGKP